MIHLRVPFYVDARPQRRAEIEDSVRMNLANEKFSSVTLFCEKQDASAANVLVPKARGCVMVLPNRALYRNLLTRKQTGSDVVVIANADIYFDETISLSEHVQLGQVLCLTRAEQRPFDEGLYWPEAETALSHDAWIFRPPLNVAGEYEFGRPGCELRFAGECEKAGYVLHNPCRHIHAIHHHVSGMRTYTAFGPLHVSGPYAHVYVTPEWPLRPPEVKKPQPAPVDRTARTQFVKECIAAQLSGLWTNCNLDGLVTTADKQIVAICNMAEKAAQEAQKRGLLP